MVKERNLPRQKIYIKATDYVINPFKEDCHHILMSLGNFNVMVTTFGEFTKQTVINHVIGG